MVYCTVWFVENSYTIVSSHSVRVRIFGLRVVVIEEHVIVRCQSYWIELGWIWLIGKGGLLANGGSVGPVAG